MTFSGNKTGSEGGALLAHGNSTVINAEATHFLRNQSEGIGGAIAVDGGASFTLRRTNKGCFNYDKCNFFDGNTASEEGGAIHNSESHVDISSTHFSSNRANIGSAYYTEGTVNSNKIEGSIFSQNGNHAAGGFNDRNVIRATNGSDITVTYSTFADNNVLFATFGLENASTMYLYSSIVYDSSSGDVFDINGGSTHDVDCLLVHESGSFNTTNAKVTVANPEFIDAANQNFHIKTAISPAVDYCSDSEAMAVHKDIDFQTRGFNNELITDLFGPYDIGADESFGNRIFMDGFE